MSQNLPFAPDQRRNRHCRKRRRPGSHAQTRPLNIGLTEVRFCCEGMRQMVMAVVDTVGAQVLHVIHPQGDQPGTLRVAHDRDLDFVALLAFLQHVELHPAGNDAGGDDQDVPFKISGQ